MAVNPAITDEVREIFEAALALPPLERPDFLYRACADPDTRRFICDMLASDEERSGPLDRAPLSDGTYVHRGRIIAGFVLEEMIGSGGMGLVYRARQQTPERDIALKVLRGFGVVEESAARFRLEAELMARLRHGNIARVISAGVDRSDGGQTLYVAMELAENGDIVSHAERESLAAEDRVRLIAQIADGVHHAHQRGIIHRDLKPSNILVDAKGVPKIVDFGVARLMHADLSIESPNTSIGQVIGTVRYMSPEQVGGSGDIDVRTDVYSLGVVLCELLTGRMPYEVPSSSLASAAVAIASAPPKNVSRIQARDGAALRAVVGKALEKDPRDRYQSAAELRDDLERVLDGRPILAKRLPMAVRAKRFARRRQRELVTSSIAALLVTAVLVGAYLVAVVRPRVANERWTNARVGLVDEEAVNGIWNVVHWDTPQISSVFGYEPTPRLTPGDHVYTLGQYDRAVLLTPNASRLRLERDLLRYAIRFCERLDPEPPRGSAVPRVAPNVVDYASRWIDGQAPPRLDRTWVEDLGDEELRALGLFSFVVYDLNTSILALTVYEQRVEPDPLIDAITGLIYIVADRPSSAYPRLRRAHEAFPESQPIRIGLADAAIRTGDITRGERYLKGVEDTRLGATTRLRVQALIARGRLEEALELHGEEMTRGNPFLDEAVLAEIERRHGPAEVFEFFMGTGRYSSRGSMQVGNMGRQYVTALTSTLQFARRAEAWWAAIGPERRAQLLADESHHRNTESAWEPYRFSQQDAEERPSLTRIAHVFAYCWRNLVMRTRLSSVMLPSGDGFEPVRPDDEILKMHRRWSEEVDAVPEDLADATLAQVVAYLTNEVGALQFSDDLYSTHLGVEFPYLRGDTDEVVNPWTGEPTEFAPYTRYEDRGLWWVGMGLEREDRVKDADSRPDS